MPYIKNNRLQTVSNVIKTKQPGFKSFEKLIMNMSTVSTRHRPGICTVNPANNGKNLPEATALLQVLPGGQITTEKSKSKIIGAFKSD